MRLKTTHWIMLSTLILTALFIFLIITFWRTWLVPYPDSRLINDRSINDTHFANESLTLFLSDLFVGHKG